MGMQAMTKSKMQALAADPRNIVVATEAARTTSWATLPPGQKVHILNHAWAHFDTQAALHPEMPAEVIRSGMRKGAFGELASTVPTVFRRTCGRVHPIDDLLCAEVQDMRDAMLDDLGIQQQKFDGVIDEETTKNKSMGMIIARNLRPIQEGELKGKDVLDLTSALRSAGYDPADLETSGNIVSRMQAAGLSTGSMYHSIAAPQSHNPKTLPQPTTDERAGATGVSAEQQRLQRVVQAAQERQAAAIAAAFE